ARKSLILRHGEMAEWLKEHAWKAKRTSDTKLRGPARRRPHGRSGPIVGFRTSVPRRGAGLTALSTAFANRRATRRALPERAADRNARRRSTPTAARPRARHLPVRA